MAIKAPYQPQQTALREETPCGFKFGAATVERCTELPGGKVVVTVDTPKAALQIHVTKPGNVRLYFNGLEVLSTR